MLDIFKEAGIIAGVEPGGIALAGNFQPLPHQSFGCNCLILFILLKPELTAASSLFRPRRLTQVSGGVFYWTQG